MQPARRLAAAAVLAVLGCLALTGCRSQPGVAAYVGNTRYTEAQIERIIDDAESKVPADQLPPNLRVTVLSWLVLNDLGRRIAAEKGVPVPAPDYAAVAEQNRLPADLALVRTYADWLAVGNALIPTAEATAPTDEDIRAIYQALRESGRLPAGASIEQVAQQFNNPRTNQVVGLRNMLADAAGRHHVTINPRYRPLVVPLGEIPLPLALGSDAVTDLASP